MPKCHCLPLRVWCISGSRSPLLFLVDEGASISVASTMVPVPSFTPRHEASKAEVVKSFECGVEPFVVSGEASEAGGPGEASFHDPAARQEHEASLGHGVFDDFEPDTVLLCGGCGVLTGIALIDISEFDGVARNLLHLLGQGHTNEEFLRPL